MRRKTNSIWNDEQNEITTTLLDVIFKRKKAFIVYKCVALLLLPFAFHVYFSPL